MRIDERAVAAGAALLLPLLGLALLARLPMARGADAARGDDALQVVWITRVPVDPVDRRRAAADVEARRISRRARRHDAGATVTQPPPRQRSLTLPAVASDPPPATAGPATLLPRAGGLDLRVPESMPSFERDPLGRSAFDIERPAALRVEIHDRSLGGRLQRMTRASICGELRRALRGGGGNVVVRTMREHGCRI